MPGSDGSPSPGDWGGIQLNGTSDNLHDYQGIGEFDWCRIRYGSSYDAGWSSLQFQSFDSGHFTNSICELSPNAGVKVVGCSPAITGSTFANNASHGLYVYNATAFSLTNNTFIDNGGYGALFESSNSSVCSGNSGSGNDSGGIGFTGTVNADSSWSGSLPFVLDSRLTVSEGVALSIDAGTVVKGRPPAVPLIVYGTLDVNGTEQNPVIFTSIKDDTYGGDTNNDGDASSPAPGDWGGIQVNGTSDNLHDYQGIGEFDWCRIRYGSSYDAGWSSLQFQSSDSGYFTNSICELSPNAGVKVVGCSPIFRGSCIENNASYGIYISGSPDLGANDPADKGMNVIQNNDGGNYQVYNASSSVIPAYYNVWGYTTAAEIDAHIYDDEEGGTGQVLFEPWLDSITEPPLGDVDGDGTVTAQDASLVLRQRVHLVELSQAQIQRGDVSGDGTLSALDASLILSKAAGLIDTFPVEAGTFASPTVDARTRTQMHADRRR